MIKLYDSQITDILPEYLSGRAEVQALSYALHLAMMRLLDYCRNISVFSAIDIVPEYVLDMLALDLNTQYYDTSLDIEAKRRLIRNTMEWYITAGTPSAVEELVASVFGEGEVKEWFEYGDSPFFFKIITNATMSPGVEEMFTKMIGRVKNTRSHFRGIEIHREIKHDEFIGSWMDSFKKEAIINSVQRCIQARSATTIGCGLYTFSRIIIGK